MHIYRGWRPLGTAKDCLLLLLYHSDTRVFQLTQSTIWKRTIGERERAREEECVYEREEKRGSFLEGRSPLSLSRKVSLKKEKEKKKKKKTVS